MPRRVSDLSSMLLSEAAVPKHTKGYLIRVTATLTTECFRHFRPSALRNSSASSSYQFYPAATIGRGNQGTGGQGTCLTYRVTTRKPMRDPGCPAPGPPCSAVSHQSHWTPCRPPIPQKHATCLFNLHTDAEDRGDLLQTLQTPRAP